MDEGESLTPWFKQFTWDFPESPAQRRICWEWTTARLVSKSRDLPALWGQSGVRPQGTETQSKHRRCSLLKGSWARTPNAPHTTWAALPPKRPAPPLWISPHLSALVSSGSQGLWTIVPEQTVEEQVVSIFGSLDVQISLGRGRLLGGHWPSARWALDCPRPHPAGQQLLHGPGEQRRALRPPTHLGSHHTSNGVKLACFLPWVLTKQNATTCHLTELG